MDEKDILDKYLGKPYKHQGRNMSGLDCYGLVINVYEDLGYQLLDIDEDYSEDWNWKGKNYFIENYYKQWEKVPHPNLFDVVLFHNAKGIARHGGVVLSGYRFLHCCKQGVVVGDYRERRWAKNLTGFFRLKARDYGNS